MMRACPVVQMALVSGSSRLVKVTGTQYVESLKLLAHRESKVDRRLFVSSVRSKLQIQHGQQAPLPTWMIQA